MNSFIETLLSNRHSTLLLHGGVSDQEVFGFECMDGWSGLIEANLRLIQRYAEVEALDVKITQVKEKFGLLRIYQRGGEDSVCQVIEICELASGCICELCGNVGEVTIAEDWLITRCDKHQNNNLMEYIEAKTADERYLNSYVETVDLILSFFRAGAVHWVRQENIGLGGRRPYEMLATEEGCCGVYRLLKRLEYGVGV